MLIESKLNCGQFFFYFIFTPTLFNALHFKVILQIEKLHCFVCKKHF